MRNTIPNDAVEAGARSLADWLHLDFDRIGEGQATLRRQADAVLNAAAPVIVAAHFDGPVREFLEWLVRMDDLHDEQGCKDRQTVTLTAIIDRARQCLGEAS